MFIVKFIFVIVLNFILIAQTFAIPIIADDEVVDNEYSEAISNYKNMYSLENDSSCTEVYDPYEKLNRQIYKFNSTIDFLILRPLAKGYDKVLNDYTKNRVSSFVQNINTPITALNYGLQLNYDLGMKSFWRFAINSTFGILGVFDVATKMGISAPEQTFGNTLAHYGVGPGPYLMLPFFGGTMTRNISDAVITTQYFLPTDTKMVYTGVSTIHQRAKLLPFTDHIMENSVDSYVAIRSAVYQNRESTVKYPKKFICPTQKK